MNNFNFNKLNPRHAKFAPPLFLSGQDLYSSDTVQNHPIGTMAFGDRGKIFRYSLNGLVLQVQGTLLQSPVQDTSYENMAVLASPIVLPQNGLQTVNITNGTATITNAQYVDGSVSVYTTPDLGGEYTILGVSGTLTTGGALTVTLDHPLATAWNTSTKVNMKREPRSGVIIFPTTQTGIAAGVSIYATPASTASVLQYSWIQTHGMANVLSDGSTFAVGSDVDTSLSTAGAVGVNVAGTTHSRVGIALQAAASGHGISTFLQID